MASSRFDTLARRVGQAAREVLHRPGAVAPPVGIRPVGADRAALGLGGTPLAEATGTWATVEVPAGLYAGIASRSARIALLRMAADRARDRVVLHVVVRDDGTHAGRVVIDWPRRVLGRLGRAVAEEGDRFERPAFVHLFFDEETLIDELAEAGLGIVSRRGYAFETARGASPSRADGFARELVRAAAVVHAAERARLASAPADAIDAMRARGRSAVARDRVGRARLKRAIGWVDAAHPRGANCYRRTLMELALDRTAASENVVFGLDVAKTGHVALEGDEERSFDVAFVIPAIAAR